MGKGKGKAVLPDIKTMIQAGIDPKTHMPIKLIELAEGNKNDFRRLFRIIDEQDAIKRYEWFNLPNGITTEMLERLLYFKGQLCFFYYEPLDQFYFLPFALDGTIDLYGRFNSIHPIPFAAGVEGLSKEENVQVERQKALLSTLVLKVIKEVKDFDELTEEDLVKSTVLLYDYTPQLNVNNIIPRQILNDVLLDTEAEILPYMQTALLAGTGVKGMRVNDQDTAEETERASGQIRYSALARKLFVAMTSSVEIQDLSDSSPMKTEEYLLALQGLDNLRKSTLGIENGGLFQKKAHKLNQEEAMNESGVATVYQDGLAQRQNFCNLVNSIWGLNIWCMPAEAMLGDDLNMDGYILDNKPMEAASEEPMPEEGGE